jgi:hypothetical protein
VSQPTEFTHYSDPILDRFALDMDEAGIDWEDYHGRSYYHGPAARTDSFFSLQDIIRATKVKVQWDSMGRDGYIVYPL